MTAATPIRCAIYTRKSTEEGLEQAFNSLDAQREACVAHVASQRHEGWLLSPELYDDGGFSGGNINRPGLTALMIEVQAGRIDVIVVYKVDRLTRSLADFAKIVEVLDTRGASFVSVTQSFNTTTSMGRLTLNVLLSFAQFERYIEQGSVVATVKALNRDHFKTKVTYTREGHTRGGITWSRGALAHLPRNRVYIGETKHKQQHFPGEHLPIVTNDVWNSVQAQLAGNTIERKHAQLLRHANLLGGLLFDGLGRRTESSQSAKGAKRYHYYETAVDAVVKEPGTVWRVPAHDIEALVLSRLQSFLGNRVELQDAIATTTMTAHALEDVLDRAQSLGATVQDPAASRNLVRQIDLAEDRN